MVRPWSLFFHEPIIQLFGIYMAFVYGLFYSLCSQSPLLFGPFAYLDFYLQVFLTTIPVIFSDIYHEGPGIAGLHYIGLGVGLMLAAQTNARVLDRAYIYFRNKNNGVGEPEFRLREFLYSLFSYPIGFISSNQRRCSLEVFSFPLDYFLQDGRHKITCTG